jgi:thiol-disulfide isomerase/thioredoxin
MKNTSYLIKSIVIVIGIVMGIALVPSCDIVEEPYLVPVGGNDTTQDEEYVRNVLLEDFTGQKCPNCPDAAEIAHTLKELYGERLVVVALHAGFYSVPDATGSFTTDFRTAEGDDLNDFFNISMYGYPMGLINRTQYNGYPVVPKENWETAVGEQMELEPLADITITNTYNSGTRKLDCQLETEFLEELDGTFNICAFIIESGIVSPQQTEGGVVMEYEHNHMLRGSLNSTWGDLVGTDGSAVVGIKVTNNYSITLPAGWNADNCAVVVFVYDTETLEVVQAEEETVN